VELISYPYSSAFTAERIAGIASARAIRQSLMGSRDVLRHSSWLNTEYEGRFAARGYSLEETGITRFTLAPANLKISCAKSNQVLFPEFVP
jgi:hypothetical protein